MARPGKEAFIRRQKEIARQQKQKEKVAKRKDKSLKPGSGGSGDINPEDLVTLEELVGPIAKDEVVVEGEGAEGDKPVEA